MSVSVFSKTIGLLGEDTSTEVLAHLLSPESLSVPFQKLFFLKACGTPKSSSDLGVVITTRTVCRGGTPDALILTKDSIILLENKLGSPLSGEDQLVRYIKILESDAWVADAFTKFDLASIKQRVLVFLAPRVTIGASLKATAKTSGKDLDVLCTEASIALVPIEWEDLIRDLDDGNPLQRELRLYVQDYLEQELTMHERDLLADRNVPTALEKLFKKVMTIRDSMDVDGFKQGRMGQSYNYFGFSAEHKNITLWFGYSLPEWSNHSTPAVLQLRKQWIKGAEEPVMAVVKEYGFMRDEKAEWILPFQAAAIEQWEGRLREILERFAVAANQLQD